MSHRGPVRVADRHAFDVLIDARSPAEFALDHLPGAINCPVLDDEERRIVGTIYKQQGAFEARRVGGAMVAANLARHLRESFADKPAQWKPLVYCWRGGLRSGSMVTWLRLVGWDAQQLAGGYKSFRHHVLEALEAAIPQLQLRVIAGATGSAKTRVLQALAARGAQVLDLEGLARHKGSLLGALPGVPQPSQKGFETQLSTAIEAFDLSRTVYVEGESARIGRIALPIPLVARMREAACIEVTATPDVRLAYLLRDYAYLGDDREALATQLGLLKEMQGKDTVQRWQAWARAGALAPLFAELMALHYDPHYARSQERHFSRWRTRQSVAADALDDAGIVAVAEAVLGLGAEPSMVRFGDALRSRSVGDVVRVGAVDVPMPPARLTADWERDVSLRLGLEPGDVEPLPLPRARARWPDYRKCVQAMADWTRALGLSEVLASSEVALMACRGAKLHHDAAQYGGAAFCNLFLSEDKGLDLHFPQAGLRIPLTRGVAVIFDTGQPHAVVRRGRSGFDPADFAPDMDCTLVFLSWELPIEDALVARALGVVFDRDPPIAHSTLK